MDKLLPAEHTWLLSERPMPPMLFHAIAQHGVAEIPGPVHEDRIIAWAQEAANAGAGKWLVEFYQDDETPWCGLFCAMCAARSGYAVQPDCLSARGWLDWGRPVGDPGVGDVLVFWRGRPDGRSGHVGIYVGEDDEAFHVLGGNQGNAVSITRIDKTRLLGVRRWETAPAGRRVKVRRGGGKLSENEA